MAADKNFESYAVKDGVLIEDRTIPSEDGNVLDYADILKFSNCTNATVDGCMIHGGTEDCIDIVRGSGYTFRNCTVFPFKNGITIKGSADGVLLENITIDGHGKDCDIDLGQFDNYWHIGRKPTRNIVIRNVQMADGSRVVVRTWDAVVPLIENSNVKLVKMPKILWWPYFVFRAIQTRGIRNLKKPVDSDTFISTT